MDIEFDPAKARENLKKHGINFADAEQVLRDSNALYWEDTSSDAEQRHLALGMDALGRILVVVYTYRGENIRMIAAWKANAKQRRQYATQIE